jgi:hypothetical protein
MAVNLAKGLAPVVLFGYNRPQHIVKTIDALNKNRLADRTDLHIFLDAAKEEEDRASVLEVIEVCEKFNWIGPRKTIHLRAFNYGLAKNIVNGITEIISLYGKIIVLEDDLVPSLGFLNYMNDALTLYESDANVMHINGFLPETRFNSILPDSFFTRFMNCWGWATWENRWKFYSNDAKSLLYLLRSSPDYELWNFKGAINFENQLVENISGRINTWAVKWNTSIFLEKGLCLTPGKSLIDNIGLDGTGVHYNQQPKKIDNFDVLKPADYCRVSKIKTVESKLGRLYLTISFGLGRSPSYITISKYFFKRFLTKRSNQHLR